MVHRSSFSTASAAALLVAGAAHAAHAQAPAPQASVDQLVVTASPIAGDPDRFATIVAQVSRSPRQAQLRRFLRGCEVVAFDPETAHEVGSLLARSPTSDVVDAHLAVLASRSARAVVSGDPDDLRRLSEKLRPRFPVVAIG